MVCAAWAECGRHSRLSLAIVDFGASTATAKRRRAQMSKARCKSSCSGTYSWKAAAQPMPATRAGRGEAERGKARGSERVLRQEHTLAARVAAYRAAGARLLKAGVALTADGMRAAHLDRLQRASVCQFATRMRSLDARRDRSNA